MTASRIQRAAWWIAVAFAWCWAWRHLAIEWRTNEQYEFGFGVPFLFFYIAWKRWDGPMRPSRRGSAVVLLAAWLALALGELLRWHDPVWRFTGGLLVLGATLLTAAWLCREGGAPLLRREFFPIAFAWLALPWPVPAELFVTQHLLHFVTSFTTAILNDFDIAAWQRGNLIELSCGVIGVGRACSGVQSLQASLVASLFLGEFFRLNVARRTALFFGGCVAAVVANFLRVLSVSLLAHAQGLDAAMRKHDLAGGIVTSFTFLMILSLALILARGTAAEKKYAPVATAGSAATGGFSGGVAVLVFFAAIPLLCFTWFSRLQIPASEMPQTPCWKLDAARLPEGWIAEPVAPTDNERATLQFSEWHAFSIQSPSGWTAKIVHLFWKPGAGMPGMAFYHTPAMCMPWVGWRQVGAEERVKLPLHSGDVPFVLYRFDQEGERQVVLQSLASAGRTDFFTVDPQRIGGRLSRLAMLWREPLRQVNEELLIYLPDAAGTQPLDAGRELLDAVVRDFPAK
jgi:exosortase